MKIAKMYNSYTSKRPVLAGSFEKSIRDHLFRPVIEESKANLVERMNSFTKQNKKSDQSSTKMPPVQAFF